MYTAFLLLLLQLIITTTLKEKLLRIGMGFKPRSDLAQGAH